MLYIMHVLRKQKVTYTSYYNLNSRQTPPSRDRGFIFRLPIWLVIIIFCLLGLKLFDQVRSADRASALETAAQHQAVSRDLGRDLKTLQAANPQITYSISAIGLGDDDQVSLGNQAAMPAASVGKLITATAFLHRVESHQASLGQQLSGYQASDLLRQMINQSDDGSWAILNDYLGHPALDYYAHSLGLSSYSADTNTISASDIAKLLRLLYEDKLLNAAHTRLLLSFMQNTNYENLITPALPPGYTIYHKVGLDDDNVNDAAIITHDNKAIVLVIFTDGHGVYNWPDRAAQMQTITRQALKDYF